MTALLARWRSLSFPVRLGVVLLAGVAALLLLRSWTAAAGITAGLLAPDFLHRQGRRARAGADKAQADTADLLARARDAQRRADARAALAEARRRTFEGDLRTDLEGAGDEAERRARRRLRL